MKIGYRGVRAIAVFYAMLPIAIFYIGWLNAVGAALFVALAVASVFFFLRNASSDQGKLSTIRLTGGQLAALAAIALVWCFAAGQGGFVHQSNDHIWRNAILRDLIARRWPVVYDGGGSMLCYYIAHWMVPAAIGKLALLVTGSTFAGYLTGNIALLLWSSLGIFIVLLLVVTLTNTGKRQRAILAVFLFIFFSGLDIVGVMLRHALGGNLVLHHLEWWAKLAQYSSITTCLYWVYNQAIVPWMLVLCLMNERTLRNAALLGILAFPYGPFPFVGIVLLCFLNGISGLCAAARERRVPAFIREVLSPQNLLALLAIAPVYLLYYTSNNMVSGEKTGFRVVEQLCEFVADAAWAELGKFAFVYALFVLLEAGVYVLLILRREKPGLPFVGMSLSLLVYPLVQLGSSGDFSMRASIPALLYLCITFIRLVMRELPERIGPGTLRGRRLLAAAMLVFVLGMATPCVEVTREILRTLRTPYSEIMDYTTNESLQDLTRGNFVAMKFEDSAYYRLLSRRVG